MLDMAEGSLQLHNRKYNYMSEPTYIPSSSSMIEKFRHDTEENVLHIIFRSNGRHYAYADVSAEEFADMRMAPSHGKWYNENIKGIKESTEL